VETALTSPVRVLRHAVAAALACGSILAVTVLGAPAALAHDTLEASTPTANAEVSGLKTIELEYSGRIRFPVVVLHTAAGRQITLGTPEASGPKVTATVPQPLPGGKYVIAWRVVSSDGHPIEGEIPFTVKGAPGDESSAAASAPVSAPAATPAAPAASSASADAGQGVPTWLWGGLIALVVLGVVVWLLTRRATRAGTPAK
jgi:methionine-rich copper-binding protein CopC